MSSTNGNCGWRRSRREPIARSRRARGYSTRTMSGSAARTIARGLRRSSGSTKSCAATSASRFSTADACVVGSEAAGSRREATCPDSWLVTTGRIAASVSASSVRSLPSRSAEANHAIEHRETAGDERIVTDAGEVDRRKRRETLDRAAHRTDAAVRRVSVPPASDRTCRRAERRLPSAPDPARCPRGFRRGSRADTARAASKASRQSRLRKGCAAPEVRGLRSRRELARRRARRILRSSASGPCRRCNDHANAAIAREPSSFSIGSMPSAMKSGPALTRRSKKRSHGSRSAKKPGSYMRRELAVKIGCRHGPLCTVVVVTIVIDSRSC